MLTQAFWCPWREAVEARENLWNAAIAHCPQASFQSACSLALPALGNLFEVALLRAGASEKHPPQIIYFMLFGLGHACSLLAGFGMAAAGARSWVPGLDPALRLDFYDIAEARRAAGATVVLSSHALAELGDRAGRIIIMNRGKIVANGLIDYLRDLARLPSKIRCKAAGANAEILSNKLVAAAVCRRVNGHTIEFDASASRQMGGLAGP